MPDELSNFLRSLPEITESRVRGVSHKILSAGAWHPDGSGSLVNKSRPSAIDLSKWRGKSLDEDIEKALSSDENIKKALSWVFDPLMEYLSHRAICSLLSHYRPNNGTWDYRAFSPAGEGKWTDTVCQTMRVLSLHKAAREHEVDFKILLPVELLHETTKSYSLLILLGNQSNPVRDGFRDDHDILQLDCREHFKAAKQKASEIHQQRKALADAATVEKIKDRFEAKRPAVFCWEKHWGTSTSDKDALKEYIKVLPLLCSEAAVIDNFRLKGPLGKWKGSHLDWDVSDCWKSYIGWLHELSPDIQAVLAIPAWPVEQATDGDSGDATGALVIAFAEMPTEEELSQIPLIFRIGASFAYVAAQVARNVAGHAFRSAVVGLQARSMAHNLGSHLLPNALEAHRLSDSAPEDSLRTISYLPWSEVVQQRLRELGAECQRSYENARRNEAVIEYMRNRMIWTGLAAASFPSFPVDLRFKKEIIGSLFHPWNHKEESSSPRAPILRLLLADELRRLSPEENDEPDVTVDFLLMRADDETQSADLLVAIPYGRLGVHSFHSILENMLRNAAKYGRRATMSQPGRLTLKVVATRKPEWLEIVIWDNWSTYTEKIWKTISSYCVPGSRDEHVLTDVEDAECWRFMHSRTTEPIVKGGGIKEMRTACAWLRGDPLSQDILHRVKDAQWPLLRPVIVPDSYPSGDNAHAPYNSSADFQRDASADATAYIGAVSSLKCNGTG